MVYVQLVRRRVMAVCAVALLSVLAIIVSLQLTDRALPLPACRTVALQVISSTEKSALLSRLAARYNASRPAALPGVCPAVSVKELSSTDCPCVGSGCMGFRASARLRER